MIFHPMTRVKKNFHFLERERREKGRNLKPNHNLAKGERRKICPKLNASIVMNSGTLPWSVHTKRKEIRPWEEQQVKTWIHGSSFTLPLSHAWSTQWWGACGTWNSVHHSTWHGVETFLVTWRRNKSRWTSSQGMTEGKPWPGLVPSPFGGSQVSLSGSRMSCSFQA